MRLRFSIAAEAEAAQIARLRVAVAEHLTAKHGRGHWSGCPTERGVLYGIRTSKVVLARRGAALAGTLRLATKKPWAIDVAYFTAVPRAVYLHDMAVAPALQGRGVGRALLTHAEALARAWPAAAIRLDAYDAEAGAGGFYANCGYREVGRVVYRGVPLIYFERLL